MFVKTGFLLDLKKEIYTCSRSGCLGIQSNRKLEIAMTGVDEGVYSLSWASYMGRSWHVDGAGDNNGVLFMRDLPILQILQLER